MPKAVVIEYEGLGQHDEDLQSDIEEILARFNEAQNTNYVYLPETGEFEGYWSVRSSESQDAADFRMFVVYDDETAAHSYTAAQNALVEEILAVMQECSERQGFEEPLKLSEYYDAEDYSTTFGLPAPKDFFDMIKASWR